MRSNTRIPLVLAALVGMAVPAAGASYPAIKTSEQNKVPACVSPGRLGAFLSSRNAALDRRFDDIATHYMRHGEALHVRWDYAFFQMLLETGNLAFQRDVKPAQNNFAGLGAVGRGEPGESFADVSSGVKAHLQHLLMYSGEIVDDPVAERTRKVQEWGILKSWQKGMKAPITFSDLARKWAPGDRRYAGDIDSIAKRFFSEFCERPDPHPELVAVARQGQRDSKEPDRATALVPSDRDAAEPQRGDVNVPRLAAPAPPAAGASATAAVLSTPRSGLNAPKEPPAKAGAIDKPTGGNVPAGVQTAAGATAVGKQVVPAKPGKCRVWTASYGGQKAIIIKAMADQFVNYTVLDVNEGAEKRETDAYIAAYARGGETIGTYPSQTQALDKAFELCPDG